MLKSSRGPLTFLYSNRFGISSGINYDPVLKCWILNPGCNSCEPICCRIGYNSCTTVLCQIITRIQAWGGARLYWHETSSELKLPTLLSFWCVIGIIAIPWHDLSPLAFSCFPSLSLVLIFFICTFFGMYLVLQLLCYFNCLYTKIFSFFRTFHLWPLVFQQFLVYIFR